VDDYLPWHRHATFPVVDDDGLVAARRINQVPASERSRITLRDAACPLPEVAAATPDEPVADVLTRLNACSEGRVLVFSDGHLAGIVSPDDVSRALERLGRHPGRFGSAGR
jgi:CBS domain-containing protein